ncbi:UNVERIFIED_CONTAM: hypothetical protein PYX00_004714 [Menopon gallinae]|uniref:CRAL-TRIO domain-containing protein n=1 Tax=Menopon gallinae TaxID=328185 RepID=A0AAW2I5Q0_9NEOP
MGGKSKFFDVDDDEDIDFKGSDELKKVAEEELRETDSLRATSLQQLREAIRKHPDIKKCRTDSPFLLRFLRTKKFSVPLALAMIERYLAIRQLYPHWFKKLDVDDPVVNEILDSGYLVPLPMRDERGRRVIFSCAGNFDPYKYTATDMIRTHTIVVEALMDDEENQIKGYTYINDERGLSMAHVSLWSFTDIRSIMKCIQNSTPMRHKSTHFINVPHYANKVFEFFSGLLSEKLKNRLVIHNNMDDFKNHFGTKILPQEYGGDMSLQDMIAQFKLELKKQKEAVAVLEDLEIDLTKRGKIPEFDDELSGVAGSFRKLEVD